jgi:hypothetical protein
MSDTKPPPFGVVDTVPTLPRLAEIAWHALLIKGMTPHAAATSAMMYAAEFAKVLASHGKTEKAEP